MTRHGEVPARLTVLGMVQLTVGDRQIPLTRLERTVLAGLAVLPDQPVSASTLAEWVWGDRHRASPRNRVQALVSGIRRKADSRTGVVLTVDSGYRLATTVSCDVTDLLTLRRQASSVTDTAERSAALRGASALATRTPLDGCVDSPLVELKRTQLGEDARQLHGERIEADLAAGSWTGLGAELRSLTEQYPYDETFTGQLMRVLALTGRPAEALAVYREAYQRAVDELGIPPSHALTTVHERILRGEIGPPQPSPSGARHEFTPPIPRTVPRTVASLVGRDAEVATVTGAAEATGGPPVVSVTGLSGLGKSALAIECAHRLRDRFSDGSLYLAMDSDTGRAGPAEVLALFLRLLGVSGGHIPDGHDARAAMFRSVIDDRNVLVVLDDVPEGFDVTDLLPTRAGSMAILTSRRPIPAAVPTVRLRLTSLSTEDSVSLLSERLGDERVRDAGEDALRLAGTCGGVPLLLRVMAQRLASRPDLSLGQAADQLAEEIAGPEPEAAVLAGLGIAEAPLPAATRTVLRDVAGLPFPLCSRWVFDTVGGSPGGGDRALDELVEAGFVDPVLHDGNDPQYQLHDLVRLHLRGSPPAGTATVELVAEHLLSLVRAHAEVFPAQLIPAPPTRLPGAAGRVAAEQPAVRPSPQQALRFFRTEYDNVLTTARTVCRIRPDVAWRLLALTGNHVHTALDPQGWLVAAGAVRSALPRNPPDARCGRSYLSLVEASLRHEWAESSVSVRLAGRVRRRLAADGDLPGAVAAAVVLGRAYRATGDRNRAESVLRWADRQRGGSASATSRGYVALAWGSLCNDYDQLEPALDHYQRAVSEFDGTGDWSGTAIAHSAMGMVLRRLRRYAEGLPRYDLAMELFGRLADRKSFTAMLDGRADLMTQMGEPERALPDASAAVRRAARAQDPFLLHRAQRTLGRVYRALGRYDEAAASLRQSADGFEAMGRPLSLAATLRDLGQLYRLRQRYRDARQTLLQERDCLRSAGVTDLDEVERLLLTLDGAPRHRRHVVG